MVGLKQRTESARKRIFDACVATGLRTGQRNYTKFIILGRGRSGSTWLRTLLNSHEHIRCFGELFNAKTLGKNSIGWSVPGYRTKGAQLTQLQTDPVAFVRDEVFAPMPVHIEAVGFKLFYYHARNGDLEAIWDYLQALELKVLHIKRRNLLASCLSTVAAADTGFYKLKPNQTEASKTRTYEISYETCLKYFEATREFEGKYSDYSPNTLSVCFEDLVADPELETDKIQRFLGVEPKRLSSPLQRQNRMQLKQRIKNFNELKTRFSGTPYAMFFED